MYFPIISMLCSLAPFVLPVIYIQGCLSVGRHQARGTASVSGNLRGIQCGFQPPKLRPFQCTPQKHLLLDLFCSDLKGKTCCKFCKSFLGARARKIYESGSTTSWTEPWRWPAAAAEDIAFLLELIVRVLCDRSGWRFFLQTLSLKSTWCRCFCFFVWWFWYLLNNFASGSVHQ